MRSDQWDAFFWRVSEIRATTGGAWYLGRDATERAVNQAILELDGNILDNLGEIPDNSSKLNTV